MNRYSQTTDNITVSVEPAFLEYQSVPYEEYYAWAYFVTLENHREDTVQLLNRYWKITDAEGHVKEVRGPGVIGEQPVLKPGASYEYSSGTMLPTDSGMMGGTYQMVDEEGKLFDIVIPTFSLDSPQRVAMAH